jgi:murein tripeptide amidase MpaA
MHATPSRIDIHANFDTGNIQVLDTSDPADLRLAIRPDTRSAHAQWFHFRAEGLAIGQTYTFVLGNAAQSSYPSAWPGYQATASVDGAHWFRVPTEYDGQSLRFTVKAQGTGMSFAYFEPYREARHLALLERARGIAGMHVLASGKSLEGRDLPLFRMGNGDASKRKVWLIAQQHPGEHMAEWFMEGIITALEQAQPWTQALLQQVELYLIPNMNPDGAFHGHLRTNAAGKDLNRAWQDATPEETPEVHFALGQMQRHGVDLFIDAHGDEEIPHVFTAACEGNPGYTPRIADLEARFRQALCDQTPDFQQVHGYARDLPGRANLRLACNAVGQRFDCLSMTLEMPFKDHLDAPNPHTGWSGTRSGQLAQDMLKVVSLLAPTLRE